MESQRKETDEAAAAVEQQVETQKQVIDMLAVSKMRGGEGGMKEERGGEGRGGDGRGWEGRKGEGRGGDGRGWDGRKGEVRGGEGRGGEVC